MYIVQYTVLYNHIVLYDMLCYEYLGAPKRCTVYCIFTEYLQYANNTVQY